MANTSASDDLAPTPKDGRGQFLCKQFERRALETLPQLGLTQKGFQTLPRGDGDADLRARGKEGRGPICSPFRVRPCVTSRSAPP